jgi:protein-S-isoprenylcysteine O-methyltransferase Ste14
VSKNTRILASRIFAVLAFAFMLMTQSAYDGKLIGNFLAFVGLLLVAVAIVGRLWCSLYISGYKNAELITAGPYSLTRNPLYFFSLLGFVGVACATQTFTFPVLVTAAFAVGYPATINNEEDFLRCKFGEAFDLFCKRTPRFFPSFRNYREAETWQVHPGAFLRTVTDVVWFVWLSAIIEFSQALGRWAGVKPLMHLF